MKKISFIIIFLISFYTNAQDLNEQIIKSKRSADFNLELLNMFLLRNDTDFDRTPIYYDKFGQEQGLLGTFLKPMITLRANNHLRFYWESEIGLDLWGRNNPDVGLNEQNSELALGIKQREIYGELNYEGFFLKAGFQRVIDVSTLFVNHWIGALKVGYDNKDFGAFLIAGEYPDQTYKGWDFSSASFNTDVFLLGLDGYYCIIEELKLYTGIYFVDDMHTIDRRRQITAFEGKLSFEKYGLMISLSGTYMMGYRHKGGADLKNIDISAYGFTLNAGYNIAQRFVMDAVFTYMSSDDGFEGNDSGAFLFSSRRAGPSLLLSENDIRPIGDNLDKRIGAYDGVFYEMKAGLLGLDLGLYYLHNFIKVGPITGLLFTTNSDNSMGSNFVGWENNLLLDMTFFENLFSFQLIGGILIPGEAGAAFINQINRTDYTNSEGEKISVTEPIYYTQSGILMRF